MSDRAKRLFLTLLLGQNRKHRSIWISLKRPISSTTLAKRKVPMGLWMAYSIDSKYRKCAMTPPQALRFLIIHGAQIWVWARVYQVLVRSYHQYTTARY